MKKRREMVEKIIDIIKDFDDNCDFTDEYSFLSRVKDDCKKFKVKYKYFNNYDVELRTKNITSEESILVDDTYADIRIYRIKGDKTQYISNCNKQPNNELLMSYSHSTGSYMFGGGCWSNDEYYDSELFDMYFEELKKYKYSYIDEVNHYIYFTVDEGMKLYKNYKEICDKYQKLFNERRKQAKADKLRKQLEELEKGETL